MANLSVKARESSWGIVHPEVDQDVVGKALLQQSDFTYLGKYVIGKGLQDLNYGGGLAVRRVSGQPRLLIRGYESYFGDKLWEFSLPANYGDSPAVTQSWNLTSMYTSALSPDEVDDYPYKVLGNGNYYTWFNFWWNPDTSRLWYTHSIEYPGDTQLELQKNLAWFELGSGGTIPSSGGLFGMTQVGEAKTYGGFTKVPAWFQSQYGVEPYMVVGGGYRSRQYQGPSWGIVSMGPTAYAIPDLSGLSNGTLLTADQFTCCMDHTQGNGALSDWNDVPTVMERGHRGYGAVRYYPSIPDECPNGGPHAEGLWYDQSPNDGKTRWIMSDQCFGSTWIDGASKHGFVVFGTFQHGDVYYCGSTLYHQGLVKEIQVYDPAHLGEVALGARSAWNTVPASRWELTDSDLYPTIGGKSNRGVGYPGNITGAFDPVDAKLYISLTWGADMNTHIYVYQVDI